MEKIISAALGKTKCDLLIQNVSFLDVFSCEWKISDVAIANGVIVGVDSGYKAHRTLDAKGKFLVPGFIDAHVHVESSLLTPTSFESAVLPKGTTTAICDPHELSNVVGAKALEYFLSEAENLNMDLRVMLSSCVPATHLETNGGGTLNIEKLLPFINHQKALGLAEMMNVPGVLNADPDVLAKIKAFQNKPMDGHCPLVRGKDLSAYASTGISSCHESSELSEAKEKLMKGIAVWIREGSVAKDLKALSPLLTLATSTSIGFCTDDRNPLEIAHEGHLDYLIRKGISYGIDPKVAYRAASWTVARHYGLHIGKNRVGAIAPGYCADLVLLNDSDTCSIDRVFKSGVVSNEVETKKGSSSQFMKNTMHALVPEIKDFEAPKGRVHVIHVIPGKIITDRSVMNDDDLGVAKLTVLERHGKNRKPSNAYVFGFGANFKGAIASSVGHDSHNLIVVGSNAGDQREALASLIDCGGGFVVVQNKKVLAKLELPLGGLMSEESPQEISKKLIDLRKASHAVGCELSEPFLQLAFLSLPVIPSLKLTDLGLVDVNQFKIIGVQA